MKFFDQAIFLRIAALLSYVGYKIRRCDVCQFYLSLACGSTPSLLAYGSKFKLLSILPLQSTF